VRGLKLIGERFLAVYDKLLALVVLAGLLASVLYLAVEVGMIWTVQKAFEAEIDAMRPKHPDVAMADPVPYERAQRLVETPEQIPYAAWTNVWLFVPETRVWCVDCRMPIPIAAKSCPFCSEEQPVELRERPEYDGDKDEMWDSWERQYGLNPFDPSDALKDADNDRFSNLAEFRGKTNPRDPNDFPPPEAELCLRAIQAKPFKLRFMSVSTLPDGSSKFAVNLRDNSQTYFIKEGNEVEGFRVEKYEPKQEMREVGGTKRRVNVSVLTLSRGGKMIPLVMGEDVPYNDYTASLFFALDRSMRTVSIDQEFDLVGKKYKVIRIDTKRETVLIARQHDGKEIEIRKCVSGGTKQEATSVP
jgi:hypothetical protein